MLRLSLSKVAGLLNINCRYASSALPQLLKNVESELDNISQSGLWKHERVITTKQGENCFYYFGQCQLNLENKKYKFLMNISFRNYKIDYSLVYRYFLYLSYEDAMSWDYQVYKLITFELCFFICNFKLV